MAVNAGGKGIATTRSRDRFPMLESLGASRVEAVARSLALAAGRVATPYPKPL